MASKNKPYFYVKMAYFSFFQNLDAFRFEIERGSKITKREFALTL